ncbi:type IV toxin-antitoxin system AbiEi family antitoxin domain-containing protein [Tessaracoccus sp. MC1865]|uniref:type IV toxin-antitoxin system AbiEi family antitoxin domain-containing protein n=1 Tax=Tessaracoccus sp. MC1865 TaxID=2760310 RepID=UPI001601A730|nr:type IV toxin-antitoxin system AbiEi family antitoxin domain-containing protein [Tessaracoccus sp. MC1865]MBB1482595.1 type IV toxin-antitoxin system AbiEi family antitoxin domain-containing protein [Tessaracoccus sp. MC1865]QTO37952.1 type IV toxin-antitoxin system AbiEi family antitoxin domain-containing protein [Tessaracoccus sp. MC1865]
MRHRQHLSSSLEKLAADQAGVLSTRQLLDGGLSRKVISRMAQGWRPVAQGLYLLGAPSFTAAAWAGILRGGKEAAVGGRAAGHVYDIVREAPTDVTIWVPTDHQDFTLDEWRITFRRGERRRLYTLPRTSVEEALLDIADTGDENETVSAVARALAKDKTTTQRISEAVDGRSRVGHRAVLAQLCTEAANGIESALEWRFHTNVLIPHGLPIPERQVRREAGRVDGIYRDYKLILELDGLADHQDATRDMDRDNLNVVQDDSRTLRYGWTGANQEACAAARQMATVLGRGGWPDQLRSALCCRTS